MKRPYCVGLLTDTLKIIVSYFAATVKARA